MGQTNAFENESEMLEKNNYLNQGLTESKNIFCNNIGILFSSCKQKFLRLFINYWPRRFRQGMESMS